MAINIHVTFQQQTSLEFSFSFFFVALCDVGFVKGAVTIDLRAFLGVSLNFLGIFVKEF
jgi:hypothetical protein